jgi:hypothetical protein
VLFDRVRPFITRGALLVALTIELAFLPAKPPIVWAFLVPAAVQVALEIALEPTMRREQVSEADTWVLLRPIVKVWRANYERIPVNITGLLGGVAVVANMVAVLFLSGTHDPGWLRVAAFATAVLYCCSGTLGPLTDAPFYSPLDRTPSFVRLARPFAWLVIIVILVVFVLIANDTVGPWVDQSLPYALLVCALPYYIGLRARDYERDLGAAAVVMAIADAEERRFIALEVHDMFQPAKHGLERVIETADLTSAQRSGLRVFLYDMNDLYAQAKTGLFDHGAFAAPIENRIRAICETAQMEYGAGSVFELEGRVDEDNYRLARTVATTLTDNAKQAYETLYETDPGCDVDNSISVAMTLVDHLAVVEISDRLQLIPEHIFARDGSTLGRVRHTLERRGGTLTQHATPTGKTIRATWSIHLMPVRDANRSDDEEG